jgi:hypothetical protein
MYRCQKIRNKPNRRGKESVEDGAGFVLARRFLVAQNSPHAAKKFIFN